MRLVLYYNGRSGRGRAPDAARAVAGRLESEGVSCVLVEACGEASAAGLAEALSGADALAVVGGDGTVSSAAGAAMAAGRPLYHIPMGNENLFAREFGMKGGAEGLLSALRAGRVREVDVGLCNGRPFLLMCSVGADAAVVHRVARGRNGTVSHLSYAWPVARELMSVSARRLVVRVDGSEVVGGAAGMALVANSGRYALGIDPARRASMDDGALDVVFFPGRSGVAVAGRLALSRLGLRVGESRARGRVVEIESVDGPSPAQVDGEAAAWAMTTPLRMELGGARLSVLAG